MSIPRPKKIPSCLSSFTFHFSPWKSKFFVPLPPTMKLFYSLFAAALAAPAVSAEIYFKEQFNDDVSVVCRHGLSCNLLDGQKWKRIVNAAYSLSFTRDTSA
jgi:hypothetical protein